MAVDSAALAAPDTRGRSIIKAFSWRTIATLITGLLAWRLTGHIETALALGSLDAALKLAAFYGHERVWQRIQFGR
ncbi:MAG TPA: DUF2061 domain-containing protein [Dehalococcoidia bacterium]|nr:DUF2061 domain-containing protein [Dehalococcoidia bacterium]